METSRDGRRRRSDRTRRQIVDAAGRLFVERGYLLTTIEEIAREAGVSVQTVYYAFGTKVRVLSAVLDARIAGEAPDSPVMERDWAASLGASGSAADAIEALAAAAVDIFTRTAPVYEVVRRAASDPDVGALLGENRRARRSDQRQLVGRLRDAGVLPTGLDIERAADAVYAVLNEEVYQLLVVDCGWTPVQLRAWLSELLRQQLAPARTR
jgi:AcrR family transcriptional regulator